MSRIISLAIAVTLLSAFALYALKYDTRELETRVNSLERQIERASADISVLTAEKAHLLRPDRVDKLARDRLGLRPVEPGQFVSIDEVPLRAAAQVRTSPTDTGSARRGKGGAP